MQERELDLWPTKLFNDFLAAPANAMRSAMGRPAGDPTHPWPNWLAMEILVVLIIMVLFAYLKSRLSADRPGKLQLTFEAIYQFIAGQAHDAVEHGYKQYVPFFGTLFIFILFMNLIGIIPGFESPTMTPGGALRARGLRVPVLPFHGLPGSGSGQVSDALRGSGLVAGADHDSH